MYSSECVDTFKDSSKTSSDGGEGDSDADTIDKCKELCLEDDDCLGFDWTLDDGADTRCWIHTDSDAFEDSKDSDAADQYTRVDCETGRFEPY